MTAAAVPTATMPVASAEVVLACRNLTVELDRTTIVNGVDLAVQAGEWVSIIGPNGAGKSTLLRALVGAVPAKGTVELNGVATKELGRRQRAQGIAWVAQTPEIPAGMRVIDYALLGRTPWMSPLSRESAADVALTNELLGQLDLAGLADRTVESLSGGERQRVLLARALVQQSSIVLLDEPTTALDLGHQQEVLDLLDELRRANSLTIISTMHDLTLAGQYADRLVLVAAGEIRSEGSADAVLTADNIHRHYGADVEIITTDDGRLLVVPKRAEPGNRKRSNHD